MELLIRRSIPWLELEALQNELIRKLQQDPESPFLLLSEPTPTFTYGSSGSPEDLLWNDASGRGITVHHAARGGKWTYHGPGQILIYPIAQLSSLGYRKREVRRFMEDFASSLNAYLHFKGLQSSVEESPFGLYAEGKKLASFGLSFRNGISSHGAALYLRPQTEAFAGIVACGSAQSKPTSLSELGIELEWETAALELASFVKRGFQGSKNW